MTLEEGEDRRFRSFNVKERAGGGKHHRKHALTGLMAEKFCATLMSNLNESESNILWVSE